MQRGTSERGLGRFLGGAKPAAGGLITIGCDLFPDFESASSANTSDVHTGSFHSLDREVEHGAEHFLKSQNKYKGWGVIENHK